MITIDNQANTLAKRYSVNPYGMIGILKVFETIQRFSGMSEHDIGNAITETAYHHSFTAAPKYTYRDIPHPLKIILRGIIRKYGSVEGFVAKPDALHRFVSGFIKEKYQPDNYLFAGAITPKWCKRGDYSDNTTSYETVEYEEQR